MRLGPNQDRGAADKSRGEENIERSPRGGRVPRLLAMALSHCRLTVKLRGRTTTPDRARGPAISTGSRGPKPQAPHVPLQRLLAVALTEASTPYERFRPCTRKSEAAKRQWLTTQPFRLPEQVRPRSAPGTGKPRWVEALAKSTPLVDPRHEWFDH